MSEKTTEEILAAALSKAEIQETQETPVTVETTVEPEVSTPEEPEEETPQEPIKVERTGKRKYGKYIS